MPKKSILIKSEEQIVLYLIAKKGDWKRPTEILNGTESTLEAFEEEPTQGITTLRGVSKTLSRLYDKGLIGREDIGTQRKKAYRYRVTIANIKTILKKQRGFDLLTLAYLLKIRESPDSFIERLKLMKDQCLGIR